MSSTMCLAVVQQNFLDITGDSSVVVKICLVCESQLRSIGNTVCIEKWKSYRPPKNPQSDFGYDNPQPVSPSTPSASTPPPIYRPHI